MGGTSKDRMKLAAELVSRGGTMLADPCPQDGGIQVRYRGRIYCVLHDDLSLISRATPVTYDTVVVLMRDVLVARLNETTAALAVEKDMDRQERLVSLAAKYLEVLQKLPK
ncbi:MAG: hypothetical protein JRM79_04015 [Nitrososphaerota archaeon]|nr:hypothetical protein [Nitrososphaerota archaeon]MDG6953126.1 hypothetical protein [Nitrososphaerota archaeon]MDG6956165.1 hypothetical protein [Nitrososphaerota archaeon]MDG6957320.1 hypothetical protein [Nitrososphaerota archaeon]MDG6958794.1 hypothetical protein [Nitrososphaerota archaeon]